ncbi:MAG: V-type ATPase subunit [Candidatus Borkfalkiaceae bacterium]|nr:V-type ATPase subunit [Clostridia bacterium]MDY6222639.1 V-type ATPase subunit [Christensenellaceae bacterium]
MIARTYVNGVIAAKEKYFLKEKLLRLIETDAENALRALKESGFGGAAAAAEENCSAETLIAAQEAETNAFIREYAASEAEKEYFLSPLDCHNVKAYFKAACTGADVTNMLADEGLVPLSRIQESFLKDDYSALPAYLQSAVREAKKICKDGAAGKGAEIGAAFEKALFYHLAVVLKKHVALKQLLAEKADLTNLVTALRAANFEKAKEQFVCGGKLRAEDYAFCFAENAEQAESLARKTGASGKAGARMRDLFDIYKRVKETGSYAEAEKRLAQTELDFFERKKYELTGSDPFLYYVLRRKTECADVRIALVCLNAGMKESEIKKRLRGV